MSPTQEKRKPRGRPSSFDREELLERVMGLFWERGYKNLSFNEIAQETGLTRASLYNAFQTKETLFMEAFNAYFETAPDSILREVKTDESVGSALYDTLKRAITLYLSDTKKRGCMGVNCMNELMGVDTELGHQTLLIYEGYKKNLKALIEQAVSQKELPAKTDPEITANMILVFLNGFSVFSKSTTNKSIMQKMALDFLKKLGFAL